MRAIDTNALVRIIAKDNPEQARAAESFVGDGGWVSHIVLAETAWVLTSYFGMSRAAWVEVLATLLDHTRIVIQDADIVSAALEAFRTNSKVGFTDCLIVEVARRAGHTPLGTFDRAFAKVDGVELIS